MNNRFDLHSAVRPNRAPLPCRLFVLLASLPLIALPALAETVTIESRTTGGATGGVTPNPPYQESPATGSWSGSSGHTTAVGTTPGIGSRFGFAGVPAITVTPTLIPEATYALEISHYNAAGNTSPNIVVSVTYSGCSGTASSTTNFNSAIGSPNWERVGLITVDAGVTTPSVTFTYASGTLASGTARWLGDAVRFINLSEPCVTALPQLTTVNGPLASGQMFVDVPGVNASATAVTVYADGVQIGQKTAGITDGVNRVAVSPLVKGRLITVTQSNGAAVESCRPASGPTVGGGANPRLRLALSIRQNTGLTGPIGSNGGSGSTVIKFLPATNVVSGAPKGSRLIFPSNDWQTVTFLRGPDAANPTDPSFLWNGTDATDPNQLKGDFGVLDALAFAIDDADSGPYQIYIDNLMNGDTLIQDFESANPGAQAVLFAQPSFSGSTTPFLLSQTPGTYSPNVSMVTNITADNSVNSLFVSWQFKDAATFDWLRLVAQGSGTPNPIVDLRLPISFRILVLPVGSVPAPTAPAITTQPQGGEMVLGGFVTLRVVATGSGPLAYQWRRDGTPISGATNSTLQFTNIEPSAAGSYTVSVSNVVDGVISSEAVLTIQPAPFTQVLAPLWKLAPGARPYVTTDGSQRSLAYNPLSGNLLVLSRAPTNAIQVLDSQTGAHLRTLKMSTAQDTNLISGGTFALNKLVVSEDGYIYACNLTEDGTTNEFRIYLWVSDDQDSEPFLVWHGDPGLGQPGRWGDSMDSRGSSAGTQIIAGSRFGRIVSVIAPISGNVSLVNVPDAEDGNFGLSVVWGTGDTCWGKSAGRSLRQVALDFTGNLGTTLRTITNYPAMSVIGLDLQNRFLAGLTLETPDTLRLLDMASLFPAGQIVDTEFFPTDNANANGTGEVRFGTDSAGHTRLFALDSNNGIIVLTVGGRLIFSLNGTMLTLTWHGAHTLQATPDLSQPFTDVDGAVSGLQVDTSAAGQVFYRLKE